MNLSRGHSSFITKPYEQLQVLRLTDQITFSFWIQHQNKNKKYIKPIHYEWVDRPSKNATEKIPTEEGACYST